MISVREVIPVARLLIATPLAWLCGIGTYAAAMLLSYNQIMSGGDFRSVAVWSAILLLIVVPYVYWPILSLTHLLLNGFRPVWVFPVVGMVLGIVPSALFLFRWGGRMIDFYSSEMVLMHGLFAVAGCVLGLAFAVFRASRLNPEPK